MEQLSPTSAELDIPTFDPAPVDAHQPVLNGQPETMGHVIEQAPVGSQGKPSIAELMRLCRPGDEQRRLNRALRQLMHSQEAERRRHSL